MHAFATWLLTCLSFDPRSRRALDETLADWTHERGNARTSARRLIVDIVALAGIFRTVASTSLAEVARIPLGWVAARTALVLLIPTVLLARIGWGHIGSGSPAASPNWLHLMSLTLPQAFVGILPVALFLVVSHAPRDRVPGLGLATGAALIVMALGAWALPLTSRQFHVATYAEASHREPDAAASILPFAPNDMMPLDLIATMRELGGHAAPLVGLFPWLTAALALATAGGLHQSSSAHEETV